MKSSLKNKKQGKATNQKLSDLADLFASANNISQMEQFLGDILTESEVEEIWQRWKIVEGLLEGRPQREVQQVANVSISKVTRASHLLKKSGTGFREVFRKIKEKT